MAARALTDVVTIVRSILKDASIGGDFTDAEINVIVQQVVEEVSQHSPNMVREVFTTIADSKEIDISAIADLIYIDHAEYPTGNTPRDERNVKLIDNETVEIAVDATPIAGGSGHLTGTVTFTSGSAAVTGVGTLFTTELEEGYHIKKSTGTRWYRIASITSATALVLAEVCRTADTGADLINVTDYCYETVYLFCAKNHTLSTTSTLPKGEEKVVIDGTVAYTALAYIGKMRENISKAVSLIGESQTPVDEMANRIAKAISDLTTGRASIGKKVTQAIAAVDSMTARITTAIDDMTTGRVLIGDKRATAITELGKISAEITLAIADIASARALTPATATSAEAMIDNMTARINQSIDNLQIGATYINKVNYGGNPENDYANQAARELSNANALLSQARGYLSEASTENSYRSSASHELQAANTLLNEARGYLALDTETTEHANYAARELSNANTLLAQARGYLMMDVESSAYGNYAARELQNASSYLNQAGGYMRQAASRLSISNAINSYQTWANNQLALYKRALAKIERPRIFKKYPTG